jgi:hypothetical protein
VRYENVNGISTDFRAVNVGARDRSVEGRVRDFSKFGGFKGARIVLESADI